MKSLTLDMGEDSMLLVGKGIGGFKKEVFDVSLLLHVTDNEFNDMILFDVRIFSVEKENFLSTISNISHPHLDSIQEDT